MSKLQSYLQFGCFILHYLNNMVYCFYLLMSFPSTRWVLKLASFFNSQYKAILGNTGVEPTIINTALTENVLGLHYRDCFPQSHIEQESFQTKSFSIRERIISQKG